jgi:hypothetical protein
MFETKSTLGFLVVRRVCILKRAVELVHFEHLPTYRAVTVTSSIHKVENAPPVPQEAVTLREPPPR